MSYGQVFYADTVNGIGTHILLFASGCTYHCPGCSNEETWDFNFGEPFTREVEDDIIEHLQPSYTDGFSLFDGEPTEAQNQHTLLPFLERVKQGVPHTTIWTYSGYIFEELLDSENLCCHTEATERILGLSDIFVDSEPILAERDMDLRFRGSRNQRILELKESLRVHTLVCSRYEQSRKCLYQKNESIAII